MRSYIMELSTGFDILKYQVEAPNAGMAALAIKTFEKNRTTINGCSVPYLLSIEQSANVSPGCRVLRSYPMQEVAA